MRELATHAALLVALVGSWGLCGTASSDDYKDSPWVTRAGVRVHGSLAGARAEARGRKAPIFVLVTHDCPTCRKKHEQLFNHARTGELARRFVLLHLDQQTDETASDYEEFRSNHSLAYLGLGLLVAADGERMSHDEPNPYQLHERGQWQEYLEFFDAAYRVHLAESRLIVQLAESTYVEDIERLYAIFLKRGLLPQATTSARKLAAKLPSERTQTALVHLLRRTEAHDEARALLSDLIQKYSDSPRQAQWRVRLIGYPHLSGERPWEDLPPRGGQAQALTLPTRLEPVLRWSQRSGRVHQEVLVRLTLSVLCATLVSQYPEQEQEAVKRKSYDHAAWVARHLADQPDLGDLGAPAATYLLVGNLMWRNVAGRPLALQMMEAGCQHYSDHADASKLKIYLDRMKQLLEQEAGNSETK